VIFATTRLLAISPARAADPAPFDAAQLDQMPAPTRCGPGAIGRDELATIQAMYAHVDAQREYAEQDGDGNGILEYAQKVLSSPGKHDGLYWPTARPRARPDRCAIPPT
jgi:Protein of unknown function (DUF2950)